MDVNIRPMTTEDADAKGYVHWKSWQETYPGLVDAGYLSRLTLEKCQQIAKRWPDNILLAELDGKIVGFSAYGICRNDDLPACGEVFALYVLRDAQGLGIGRKLMDAALEQIAEYETIALGVLKGNEQAIGFYEHYGFYFDGITAPILLGTPNTQLRMLFHRRNKR